MTSIDNILILKLVLVFTFLFLAEIIYLKIASKYNIVDNPNWRSSHDTKTIRGGGIIFTLGWLLFSIYNNLEFPWFTLGLILISCISFIDDLKPQKKTMRLLIQQLCVLLICVELHQNIQYISILLLVPLMITAIGVINSVNFMDGINGMLGFYTFAFFIPFLFVIKTPSFQLDLNLENPAIFLIISTIVFGVFNFRKKALCFSGDVGSITIGYIFVFFLIRIIFGNQGELSQSHLVWKYALFLTVFGIDVIITILLRLHRGENITSAHRTHLYQLLANDLNVPALKVSFVYAFIQLIINIWIVFNDITYFHAFSVIILLIFAYFIVRYRINKSSEVN